MKVIYKKIGYYDSNTRYGIRHTRSIIAGHAYHGTFGVCEVSFVKQGMWII